MTSEQKAMERFSETIRRLHMTEFFETNRYLVPPLVAFFMALEGGEDE